MKTAGAVLTLISTISSFILYCCMDCFREQEAIAELEAEGKDPSVPGSIERKLIEIVIKRSPGNMVDDSKIIEDQEEEIAEKRDEIKKIKEGNDRIRRRIRWIKKQYYLILLQIEQLEGDGQDVEDGKIPTQ